MAQVITLEIQALAKSYGIDRLGFLTLTFADPVHEIKEARKRFHSLATHVLQSKYRASIFVIERQRSGRLHFHGVVVCQEDIRTGVNFAEIEAGKYTSAGPYLRSEWAFWRSTAPSYRFGRTELLPVRSTVEGIARYVGKYIAKHISQRHDQDKGARLASFIGYKPGDRKASVQFAYHTPNGWAWRQKLKAFCRMYDTDMASLKDLFGNRWCYYLQGEIIGLQLSQVYGSYTFPSCWHAIAAGEPTPDPAEFDIDMDKPITIGDQKAGGPTPALELTLEEQVLILQSRYEMEEIEKMSIQKRFSKQFDEVIEDWNKVNEKKNACICVEGQPAIV